MKSNTTSPQVSTGVIRRLTLMLSGEDVLDAGDIGGKPPKGLPQERFLLGDLVPSAPVLLLGQTNLTLDPNVSIACLQPVHLHATRDHLILMGQNQVDLTNNESSELLRSALPLIEEDFQSPVLFHNQYFWFLPAGPFASLATHSVDQAHGRNIDWWMPRDTHQEGIAKRWRKLQNEIQMLWHIDPVNEAREQQGLPSINSLWISGIGKLRDVNPPTAIQQSTKLFGDHPLLVGLGKFLNIPHLQDAQKESLAGAFVWASNPESLWPMICTSLVNHQLDELALIDFPGGKVRERVFKPKDLYKKSWVFWKAKEMLSWNEVVSG
jgi:hypothetical protein